MKGIELFADSVNNVLERVCSIQIENIRRSAKVVADCIGAGGVVHTFGTGHSHLVAEEVTWRAGVLAPINAILEPSLTGHVHLTKSELTERMEGWGKIIIDYHDPGENDVIIVISNSGRNAAPIEVARESQNRGMPVIAILSRKYCESVSSRHSSGQKLLDVADIVIDNEGELGDAAISLDGLKVPLGPTSGISGMFIIHAIFIEAVELLLKQNITPPVFLSGNLDHGHDYNKPLLEKYRERIKIW